MRRNRFWMWLSLVGVFGGSAVVSQQGISSSGRLQEASMPATSEAAADAEASQTAIPLPAQTPTSAQTFITLHSFDYTDGANPFGALVQATDGDFYGTPYYGGTNGYGTIFKISPSGTLTTLYSFCSQSFCSDGRFPGASSIQATVGNLYGTTEFGGASGDNGTVFKITPSGMPTTLHSFTNEDNGRRRSERSGNRLQNHLRRYVRNASQLLLANQLRGRPKPLGGSKCGGGWSLYGTTESGGADT
jgi:uncharacterized repeat protein (TIGR03803 family)